MSVSNVLETKEKIIEHLDSPLDIGWSVADADRYARGLAYNRMIVQRLINDVLSAVSDHGFFVGIDEQLHCDCGWIGQPPFLENPQYFDHIREYFSNVESRTV